MPDYVVVPMDVKFVLPGCTRNVTASGIVDAKTVYTTCGHAFCGECLSNWIHGHHKSTCPTCRRSLFKCDTPDRIPDLPGASFYFSNPPGAGANPQTIEDANSHLVLDEPIEPVSPARLNAATTALAGAVTSAMATDIVEEMMDGKGEEAAPILRAVRNQGTNPVDPDQRHAICSELIMAISRTLYLPRVVGPFIGTDIMTYWYESIGATPAQKRDIAQFTWNLFLAPGSHIEVAMRSFVDPASLTTTSGGASDAHGRGVWSRERRHLAFGGGPPLASTTVALDMTVPAPVFPEDNFGNAEQNILIYEMQRDGDVVRFVHSTWPTYGGAPARVDLNWDWSERLLMEVASAVGINLLSPEPGETYPRYIHWERRHGVFALKFGTDLSGRWERAMSMSAGISDMERRFARM